MITTVVCKRITSKILLNHDCTKDLRIKEAKVVLHLNSNLTWHDIGDICYGDKNEYKN